MQQRRVYHDVGVAGGKRASGAAQEYDGAKSKEAKRAAARPRDSPAADIMSVFDDVMSFIDEEFWLVFFAVIYAFSLIFFVLAVINKAFGSKHRMWNWIIGMFVPWIAATTMYLIDPRWEQWSVATVTKMWYRAQELRHQEGLAGLKGAVVKWWKWRKDYKPPRVSNV